MAEETGIRENKMGTWPIPRLILSMSGPAMFSMLIQALYNVVDSTFVARGVGEDALTALTLVNPIQTLFIGVGVGTGVGINSLVARRLGAKRFEEASRAASASIKLSIYSWLPFALVGLFLSAPIIHSFTADPEIIRHGQVYMTIVLAGGIFSMMHMLTEKTIQSTGNMVMPMIATLIGCIINIILDPLLIFGWFGLPKLGVAGAAIATVFAQFISVCITFWVLLKKTPDIHLRWKTRLDRETVREIYIVGLPSIMMQVVLSFSSVIINYVLAGLSTTAVAVLGVYFRLQSFVFMPLFGLNQGTTPIFGYNYGAGDRERLVHALKVAYAIGFGIMGFGFAVFMLIPDKLLMIFDASPHMMEIGIHAFRILSLCFLPAAFGIVSGSLFGATRHGFIGLISTLVRQLVFIVPLAIIFAKIGGLDMVWWAYPGSEFFGLAYTAIMLRWVFRTDIAHLEPVGKGE